jgi:hypothetical protein
MTKIERSIRVGSEGELEQENEGLFMDYEVDKANIPEYITYIVYRAISCYYAEEYEEASRWINNLLNEVSLKKYPFAALEIKVILALQYCLLNDFDLFNQLINSVQRQIRLLGKENCENILHFSKILKISISDVKRNKKEKIAVLVDKFKNTTSLKFSPTRLIRMDEAFIGKLS